VCCSEYQTLDEVQEPSNPKYHNLIPSEWIYAFNIFGSEMWKHAQKTVSPHCLHYHITMKYHCMHLHTTVYSLPFLVHCILNWWSHTLCVIEPDISKCSNHRTSVYKMSYLLSNNQTFLTFLVNFYSCRSSL